ncbi:MAG: DJ-1/PfpI family protein [Candidatus Margulisbacteria bacterium]|nr:DJ-1/PfpI family protein [Candidatus Margulisiibacteriota bacterium]
MSKTILFILPFRIFRDEEYADPKAVFEHAGYHVITASSRMGIAEGKLGMKTPVDITIENIKVDDYDAVLFIGGSGCREYFNNPIAQKIAQETLQQNKILGAICAAPEILANAGVLQGKKATMYADTGCLAKGGATYTGKDVEVDGRIITATGPKTAKLWAEMIVKALNK